MAGVNFLSTGKCLELCNQNVSNSNGWWSLGTHSEACCGPSGAVLASTLSLASGEQSGRRWGWRGHYGARWTLSEPCELCLNTVHSSSAPWQAPRKWLGGEWAGDCGTGLRFELHKTQGETQEQQSRAGAGWIISNRTQRRLQFGGNIPANRVTADILFLSPAAFLESSHTAWRGSKAAAKTHDLSRLKESGGLV